jgi:hypothetical protein
LGSINRKRLGDWYQVHEAVLQYETHETQPRMHTDKARKDQVKASKESLLQRTPCLDNKANPALHFGNVDFK